VHKTNKSERVDWIQHIRARLFRWGQAAGQAPGRCDLDLVKGYQALVGESAWHSLTVDPNLGQVSDAHYDYVVSALEEHDRRSGLREMKVLEVASYAHTTGYRLQQELGCDVTLLDISAKALQVGRQTAEMVGIAARPRLVAGDFHALPFETDSFDLIYIASAVHHTWEYEIVISELQRVLAPGGLLLLLNEPCHRECCFYAFRTNRPANFTNFEHVLDELGVIRTFAEPYLGSRPEMLFGMIENQMIPLRRLIHLLNSHTKIIKLVLNPEHLMGELENLWLDSRRTGAENLSHLIESALVERRAEALMHFDDVAEGMRFHLPSRAQLRPFAQQVAQSLCSLPPVSDEKVFRIALSEIFGASVQVTVEKPGGYARRHSRVLQEDFEKKSGVVYAFRDRIRKILMHECSLLPDIQAAAQGEIAESFPAVCWRYSAHGDGRSKPIITLTLKSQTGRFRIPPCRHKVLIVLRYHCVVAEGSHARIRIQHRDRQLYVEQVWQTESRLWVAILPSAKNGAELELIRELAGPSGEYKTTAEGLTIAFAGAFPVD
jgi:ubiquinone/menaquinone biosynthesis C-methylase UbiE